MYGCAEMHRSCQHRPTASPNRVATAHPVTGLQRHPTQIRLSGHAPGLRERVHLCADARRSARQPRHDTEWRMTPDDRTLELPLQQLDGLTPAQARRFQLWRAMADLAKAQEDGRLSPEQARLLGTLADNLRQLSAQLSQLA